ncbi:hypothetical protein DFJ73DRAFT_759709 [Zopfochytrium polystomum]|nr:hypothetical protein DFJ73DRAFT_759709 [Zopfochytrium polystomum]
METPPLSTAAGTAPVAEATAVAAAAAAPAEAATAGGAGGGGNDAPSLALLPAAFAATLRQPAFSPFAKHFAIAAPLPDFPGLALNPPPAWRGRGSDALFFAHPSNHAAMARVLFAVALLGIERVEPEPPTQELPAAATTAGNGESQTAPPPARKLLGPEQRRAIAYLVAAPPPSLFEHTPRSFSTAFDGPENDDDDRDRDDADAPGRWWVARAAASSIGQMLAPLPLPTLLDVLQTAYRFSRKSRAYFRLRAYTAAAAATGAATGAGAVAAAAAAGVRSVDDLPELLPEDPRALDVPEDLLVWPRAPMPDYGKDDVDSAWFFMIEALASLDWLIEFATGRTGHVPAGSSGSL